MKRVDLNRRQMGMAMALAASKWKGRRFTAEPITGFGGLSQFNEAEPEPAWETPNGRGSLGEEIEEAANDAEQRSEREFAFGFGEQA